MKDVRGKLTDSFRKSQTRAETSLLGIGVPIQPPVIETKRCFVRFAGIRSENRGRGEGDALFGLQFVTFLASAPKRSEDARL